MNAALQGLRLVCELTDSGAFYKVPLTPRPIMTPAVKLMDLTDSLDMVSEESGAWLDRQTSRVIVVDNDVIQAVEDSEDLTELEDWQEDQVPAARAISAGDKRYLALPDKFDFHEYRHMERFIGTVTDADSANQLWRAIKGKGAFRYFKDTAHRLGVIEDWYRYRDETMNRFMLDWAEANQVPVDKTPGRSGP